MVIFSADVIIDILKSQLRHCMLNYNIYFPYQGAGVALRPYLSDLVCCMLESLSSLEDQRLNYVEVSLAFRFFLANINNSFYFLMKHTTIFYFK